MSLFFHTLKQHETISVLHCNIGMFFIFGNFASNEPLNIYYFSNTVIENHNKNE